MRQLKAQMNNKLDQRETNSEKNHRREQENARTTSKSKFGNDDSNQYKREREETAQAGINKFQTSKDR